MYVYSMLANGMKHSVKCTQVTLSMWSDYSSADTSVHHWVNVEAEDSGSSPLTTFYNVTIRLMDINDNPPQLLNISATCETGAPYDASVKEVCWSRVQEQSVLEAWSACV